MRLRALPLAALASIALVAGVLSAPTPAVAAPTSISGRVVDGEGRPMAGVTMAVQGADGNGPYGSSTTTTGRDGSYRLPYSVRTSIVAPVLEGRIQFANGRLELGAGSRDAQYIGGGASARLQLHPGEQATGVDFIVASRGSARISGSVDCEQHPPGGWPLPPIHNPLAGLELIDVGGMVVAAASTRYGEAGSVFELPGVAPGTYSMRVTSTGSCPIQTRYWSPAGLSDAPVPFEVRAGENGPFAVQLVGHPDTARVQARISSPARTAPHDGPGYSGYEVRLYRAVDGAWHRVRPHSPYEQTFIASAGSAAHLSFDLVEGAYVLAVGERIVQSGAGPASGVTPVCPWYSGGVGSLGRATPFQVVGGVAVELPRIELRACPAMPAGSVTIPGVPVVGQSLTPTITGWAPGATVSTVDWADRFTRTSTVDSAPSLRLTPEMQDLHAVGEVVVSAPGYASETVEAASAQHVRPVAQRLAGADRFETAASVSRFAHPGTAPVVYVASGTSFPDGLAAGPAAAEEGGPVLLTRRDVVPAATIAEIERLQPGRIVIVGGTPSVSAGAAQLLAALAPSVERVGGADRYETSRMLAERAFDRASWAVIATGASFPDALAAGGAAGRLDAPLVLVPGSHAGDAAAAALLQRLGVTDVVVAGGPPSLSGAMSESFEVAGMRTHRAAGADRYQTASLLAGIAFRGGADEVLVASGATFADALAGSAAAAARGIPIILVHPACQTAGTVEALNGLGSPRATFLGGVPTISAAAAGFELCAGVAPIGGWKQPVRPR